VADWRQKALQEVQSIKPFWATKYGWSPSTREEAEQIHLYVRFTRRGQPDQPGRREFLLRLTYAADYETAGRKEAFVNPDNLDEEGVAFWPEGVRGVNPTQTPPNICLEGTWGFHSHHHRDRDGRIANLNCLLVELEQCLNP
jgi:hypothetical protein